MFSTFISHKQISKVSQQAEIEGHRMKFSMKYLFDLDFSLARIFGAEFYALQFLKRLSVHSNRQLFFVCAG